MSITWVLQLLPLLKVRLQSKILSLHGKLQVVPAYAPPAKIENWGLTWGFLNRVLAPQKTWISLEAGQHVDPALTSSILGIFCPSQQGPINVLRRHSCRPVCPLPHHQARRSEGQAVNLSIPSSGFRLPIPSPINSPFVASPRDGMNRTHFAPI